MYLTFSVLRAIIDGCGLPDGEENDMASITNDKSIAPSPQVAPYLIVGLGNPGGVYRGNRHNVGFMTLDHLVTRMGVTYSRLESKALVSKAEHEGRKLVLAKPQTFMNLSGTAVGALMRFYKIPTENLIVCYDDVDLPLGTLRIRPRGGSAGQRGIASIIERLGTEDFPRLRVGIGRPPGRMEAADYVLQDFSTQEKILLVEVFDRTTQAILTFVTQGLNSAMNQYNG
jgi:peptidyl-tRNA hydrolase, PTH1 family